MRNADAARAAGVSATRVGTLLNDCFDKGEGRYKLPSPELIEKLAIALGADVNEGRKAAGFTPLQGIEPTPFLLPGTKVRYHIPGVGDHEGVLNARTLRIMSELMDPVNGKTVEGIP